MTEEFHAVRRLIEIAGGFHKYLLDQADLGSHILAPVRYFQQTVQ